ncbi:hypothetical protein KKC13_01110 [bacterium]|nr:hypothetical protein [bacterium]
MANDKKNVTVSLNKDIYDSYVQLCKNKGWVVSRQFERLMEEHLDTHK